MSLEQLSNKLGERTHVVLGIDDNFALPAMVTIYSASRSSPRSLVFTVLHFDGMLSDENKDQILAMKALGIDIQIESIVDNFGFDERRWLTKSTYLKLVAQDKFKGPLLWLDSDMLMLSGWDKFLSGAYTTSLAASPQRLEEANREFNAGLLFWPGDARRPWQSTLEILPKERHSSDQIVFNTVYEKDVTLLDPSFNFNWGLLVTHPPESRPNAIHYGGVYKPWHLPEKYWKDCENEGCVWRPYFAELRELRESLNKQKEGALSALISNSPNLGKKFKHREAAGRELARIANKQPILGAVLYFTLKKAGALGVAQALHPAHGVKNVWKW